MKSHTATPPPVVIDSGLIRRLAVEADVDPRTIRRALRGDRVRGMAGRRAAIVLAKHRLPHPDGHHEG